MLRRQRAQDSGREPVPADWDGTWWFAIEERAGRPLSDRRDFRARMMQQRRIAVLQCRDRTLAMVTPVNAAFSQPGAPGPAGLSAWT